MPEPASHVACDDGGGRAGRADVGVRRLPVAGGVHEHPPGAATDSDVGCCVGADCGFGGRGGGGRGFGAVGREQLTWLTPIGSVALTLLVWIAAYVIR